MEGLDRLRREIVSCEKCPRLRDYCRSVAKTKRRQFREWEYWGRPLPGFGDPRARLLIVGLAPAAHGGLRTGRMFCGDSSGDWLTRALYQNGFANQPTSRSSDDGLRLNGAYVTAVVRCAPPGNRPSPEEVDRCLPYLRRELDLLADVTVVLVLGRIAFDGYLRVAGEEDVRRAPRIRFSHGGRHDLGGKTLLVSYHPSRQNTQTGRLKWESWLAVFELARRLVDEAGR